MQMCLFEDRKREEYDAEGVIALLVAVIRRARLDAKATGGQCGKEVVTPCSKRDAESFLNDCQHHWQEIFFL